MRSCLFAVATVAALGMTVRADDAADAKALVEKAIAARGDKPGAPLPALTWKDTGKFTGGGLAMTYTADWAFQGPDKYRFTMNATFGEAKLTITAVANGDKAWQSDGKMVEEIKGDKLEYTQNEVYALWVTGLSPLTTEKGFALATAKGKDVDGKPTAAVTVTREKRPTITLYFDKATGLLVKTEYTAKDEFQKWKPVLDETFLGDYKDVGGQKVFTKLKVVRDGKTMIETTLSDQKWGAELAPKTFEKP
jgi:outer membrane lipoprotein-sorting protein